MPPKTNRQLVVRQLGVIVMWLIVNLWLIVRLLGGVARYSGPTSGSTADFLPRDRGGTDRGLPPECPNRDTRATPSSGCRSQKLTVLQRRRVRVASAFAFMRRAQGTLGEFVDEIRLCVHVVWGALDTAPSTALALGVARLQVGCRYSPGTRGKSE